MPSKNPNKLLNLLFSNKELCPQSCINENVLDDKSVRRQRMGINKNPLDKGKREELIIWWTINQREIMGITVEMI